uniref:NADH dehydrogenase [ubiquinone] 1 subunit C1, mitochondrial n=1 Tax=Neovison vison TaxID=452646 RepID=A0A8C7AAZ6_NEOVI
MISGLWDRAPHGALCSAGSLLPPLSLPASLPACEPHDKCDRLEVKLTLGTSVFLWLHRIKQHNENVLEHKRRNGVEQILEILIQHVA